jgi:elongation factor Tu
MRNIPDVEVEFEFIGVRNYPSINGYRPAHLIRDDYLTTGVHQYYDSDEAPLIGKIKGTIEFITPEYYPFCLWIGKRINIQEGSKIIGYATIIKIFNTILIDPLK